MDFLRKETSPLLNVLQEVLNHRAEDVPNLLRKLDKVQQSSKESKADCIEVDGTVRSSVTSLAVEAYFKAITSAKLSRALEKVFKTLSKQCLEQIQNGILAMFYEQVESCLVSNIYSVSSLLEQNAAIKKEAKKMFQPISQYLHSVLAPVDRDSNDNNDDGDCTYAAVKLSIQALQLFPEEVKVVLNGFVQNGGHSDPIVQDLASTWHQIIEALLQLFFKTELRDLLLLTGTSLAMIFKLLPSNDIIVNMCQALLASLSSGQNIFTFQDISVDSSKYHQRDNSIHIVAIIKGMLVSSTPSVLCEGEEPLLLTVFPYIAQLCSDHPTHLYLAFQVLALWYQKLDTCAVTSFSQSAMHKLRTLMQLQYNLPVGKSTQDEDSSKITLTSPGQSCNENLSKEDAVLKNKDDKDSQTTNFEQMKVSHQLMCRDCPVLTKTLSLIWVNWDSPVDGVTEYVLDIFKRLLKVWHSCVVCSSSDYTDLGEILLQDVLNMPWHARTRYQPLSLLLQYVDISELFKDKSLIIEDLLKCMKFNNMVACASDVYKSFLQLASTTYEDKGFEIWSNTWLTPVVRGLTSHDSLQRLKICTYWLPPTLQLIPDSHTVLLKTCERELADESKTDANWLFAWITVSRSARDQLHAAVSLKQSPLLYNALRSDQEEIRGEAVTYLCGTITRAEPVTIQEVALLKDFIPANLKTDSAPLRQNLTSAVKKVTVRIRDSCMSACKTSKGKQDQTLEIGLDFIEWLYNTLMSNLLPGGCYQRRQTCLDLLTALLETLIYQEAVVARKGKAHESSSILMQFANSHDLWNFFTRDHVITLLVCLEDGAEQIQTQSQQILEKYFKESLTNLLSEPNIADHIMDRITTRTSSPRAYESHSGLLLMSLVFKRCILERQVRDLLTQSDPTKVILSKVKVDDDLTDPAVAFLCGLVKQLKTSIEIVEKDPASSFKVHPMHGLTQCITQCLQDVLTVRKDKGGLHELNEVVETVSAASQNIINLMLEVLSGGKRLEDCPSFADMGTALDKLVTSGQDQDEEVTTLSPTFQLLLSWCWINLRESCSCLGTICELSLQSGALNETQLSAIGDTFVKILTTCRHRGAIEGCRAGFLHFCSSLITNKTKETSNIPGQILCKVLENLSDNSITASVTRRSAGLPIIIQTVVQASRRAGNPSVLLNTVEDLYKIASQPIPTDHDQQLDLCQSHALNILKVIFCDASLAPLLMPLLSKVTVLVIQGFDSPSWAVRNAATQLISTLVSRIFGQRSKASHSNSSSTTVEEFASLYPELLDFVCTSLAESVDRTAASIRPSLYVVLTLLARMGMSQASQHSCKHRQFLKSSVASILTSPVHSLRQLSAQAFVALSPFDQSEDTLREVLNEIESGRLTLNALHGWCLVAQALMSSAAAGYSLCTLFLQYLLNHDSLLYHCPSCLSVAEVLLDTARQAVVLSEPEKEGKQFNELWCLTEKFLNFLFKSQMTIQVGRERCIAICLDLLHSIQQCCHDSEGVMGDKLKDGFLVILVSGLESDSSEVQQCILDFLLSVSEDDTSLAISSKLHTKLWESLSVSKQVSYIQKCSTILLTAALHDKLTIQPSQLAQFDFAGLKEMSGRTQGLKGALFALESLVWGKLDGTLMTERFPSLLEWCAELGDNAKPTSNENLRLLSAQCLRLAGKNILLCCCENNKLKLSENAVIRIVRSCLLLLEDSEDSVRQEVALFISLQTGTPPWQSNLSYQILSDEIQQSLSWCNGLMTDILNILFSPASLKQALDSADRSICDALFEPELDSAMAETHVKIIWAFNTLKGVCESRRNDFIRSQILSVCDVAGAELEIQLDRILCSLQGPVFNSTSHDKVFACLLGLDALRLLEQKLGDQSHHNNPSTKTNKLAHCLQTLQQTQSLHPALQKDSFFDWRPT